MKIIFISGKGGVGKSTVSCALALKFARAGFQTLLVSTDQVHSFRDILQRKIGSHLTEITDNLMAVEIDAGEAIQTYFGPFMDYAVSALEKAGVSDADAWETATFPGAGELACMRKVYEYYLTTSADVMIVDTASSSETIKLLKIPSVMRVFLEKLRRSGGSLMDKFAGIVEKIFSISLPRADLIEKMVELTEDLEAARSIFSDPETTRFRIVCTPERVVIRETERFATYISILGFPVDGVYVNRVTPQRRRKVAEIRDKFYPLQIFEIPEREEEPFGFKKVEKLSREVFEEFSSGFTSAFWQLRCEPCDAGFVLRVPVRGLNKKDFEIYADGDALFIKARELTREIVLPPYLAGAEVKEATLREGELMIYFNREGEPL